MSFNQKHHIETDIEDRMDLHWDFRPRDGYVREQRYVVMSIVAPEGTNQKASEFGIKIFGCFPSALEASDYSKKLQSECNFFDYYVLETQCWAKLPPQVEKLDDIHYQEEELEKLKKSVLSMRQARAQLLEERVLAEKAKARQLKPPPPTESASSFSSEPEAQTEDP